MLCASLFCLATLLAQAQDTYRWEFPVSGDFNDKGKWASHPNDGFPTAGDFAIINAGNGYTVTIKGAASGTTEVAGDVTFQLDGSYSAGEVLKGGGLLVLRGGGTLQGGPFTISSEGSLLVDGSGLAMNGFDFGNSGIQTRVTAINGARIMSSKQVDYLPRPRLESGSEWHHTGALNAGRCLIVGGSLLAADELRVTPAELDGGRLQAGRLIGGGHAKNGSNVNADTASLNDWLLEGSGTGIYVSGTTVPGLIYADVSIKSGATFTAGALADNAWYTVDGSGSTLTVAGDITSDGPQKVTVLNQGQGSAATMTRSSLEIRDAGSVFNVADRIVDATVIVQSGARVNAGLGLGSGFAVDGVVSVVVLNGNVDTSPSGRLAGVDVSGGGRLDCALAVARGSVFGAGSFWRVGNGLVVGDKDEVNLSLGDGGRVEVHGKAMGVGFSMGGKGTVYVDGGQSASPSVLDVRDVLETGVGVGGKGVLRVLNRGRMLASKLTVGAYAGSDGTLEVAGAGASLEMGDTLEIGRAGAGQMTIFAGGLATAQNVIVGSNSETNSVRLTGAGATLTVAKSLHVGETGAGQLTIEAGTRVELVGTLDPGAGTGMASVAHQAGSVGTVTVKGIGASFVDEVGALIVGTSGQGTLNVTNGGEVAFQSIAIGGGPGASGTANISGAGSVLRSPDKLYIGGITNTSPCPGEVTVAAGGLLQTRFGLHIFKPGTLRLNGGSAIIGQTTEAAIPNTVLVTSLGRFNLGGKLIGSVLVRPGGQFLPGSSPGHAAVEGDVTLAAGTTLEMELGGPGAGTGFDQIEATGTVTLAGRLDFVFRDGFAPTNGQSFVLVQGGSVTGSFSEVNVVGLAPGFTYTLVNRGGTSLVLTATSTGEPTTAPELSIGQSAGTSVIVSWPEYFTGWVLEQTSSLTAGNWQPVAAPGNRLLVPSPTGVEFYRLVWP